MNCRGGGKREHKQSCRPVFGESLYLHHHRLEEKNSRLKELRGVWDGVGNGHQTELEVRVEL